MFNTSLPLSRPEYLRLTFLRFMVDHLIDDVFISDCTSIETFRAIRSSFHIIQSAYNHYSDNWSRKSRQDAILYTMRFDCLDDDVLDMTIGYLAWFKLTLIPEDATPHAVFQYSRLFQEVLALRYAHSHAEQYSWEAYLA